MNETDRYLRNAQESAGRRAAPSGAGNTDAGTASASCGMSAAEYAHVQRPVTLAEAWKRFWTRWTLTGRASRSEFWWMVLVNFVIVLFFRVLSWVSPSAAVGLGIVWNCATFVPWTCLHVRRLHDGGHSGWTYGLGLIPFVGIIVAFCAHESMPSWVAWLLLIILIISSVWGIIWVILLFVYTLQRSEPKTNRYGPVPNLDA